jgi:PD-(D/E)XK endonuclease
MSCASFSSARPAIRRACSSELRVSVVPFLGGSVARVAVVPSRHGPADVPATLAGMTTDQKGAIAETAIALAALRLGVEVYRPLAEGGRFDLIFVTDRLLRVQCKWAGWLRGAVVVRCRTFRRTCDGYRVTTYSADEVDAIAAYCSALDRCFLIPIDLASRHPALHLRTEPARNNQRRRVNWADDFDFAARLEDLQGAVAQLGERRRGTPKATGSSPVGSIRSRLS